MIQIHNVTKTFRVADSIVQAVKNVSFEVNDGDIFGIIGFSGAGKSTLVRCINLLERPDSGEVIVNGKDLMKLSRRELRAERKKIGMIFQLFNLFRSRTVFGNIAYPLQHTGMSKETITKRVRELLEIVGLSDKENMYPSQLSGGQKQRVGIARSLACNPDILLCDEATSALDPQTTLSILKLLKELNKKLGLTIVIITHEMKVVKTICSHAVVMENGDIVERGSIFDIFSNPQKKITKDFIATTSSLHKINNLIAEKSPLVRISENQILVRVNYIGEKAIDDIISKAQTLFAVKINIIFGDMDIIQDTPVGGLVSIIDGEKEAVKNVLAWFSEEDIKVEEIKID